MVRSSSIVGTGISIQFILLISLGIRLSALCLLGKYSPTKLNCQMLGGLIVCTQDRCSGKEKPGEGDLQAQ